MWIGVKQWQFTSVVFLHGNKAFICNITHLGRIFHPHVSPWFNSDVCVMYVSFCLTIALCYLSFHFIIPLLYFLFFDSLVVFFQVPHVDTSESESCQPWSWSTLHSHLALCCGQCFTIGTHDQLFILFSTYFSLYNFLHWNVCLPLSHISSVKMWRVVACQHSFLMWCSAFSVHVHSKFWKKKTPGLFLTVSFFLYFCLLCLSSSLFQNPLPFLKPIQELLCPSWQMGILVPEWTVV